MMMTLQFALQKKPEDGFQNTTEEDQVTDTAGVDGFNLHQDGAEDSTPDDDSFVDGFQDLVDDDVPASLDYHENEVKAKLGSQAARQNEPALWRMKAQSNGSTLATKQVLCQKPTNPCSVSEVISEF
ncbi:hypothetical protein G7Z17_g12430 [Cylindrodendrum hubeiense]|uniref:Uncharacterized protein n=1 Tax=Cylindrodendrum hubeiense TaxID=595255 RepID=A0A9P5GYC8_9HYPO|nr:hypothetical protein G7Z17_g12430 [Cylindrodendrum hubeiense]